MKCCGNCKYWNIIGKYKPYRLYACNVDVPLPESAQGHYLHRNLMAAMEGKKCSFWTNKDCNNS